MEVESGPCPGKRMAGGSWRVAAHTPHSHTGAQDAQRGSGHGPCEAMHTRTWETHWPFSARRSDPQSAERRPALTLFKELDTEASGQEAQVRSLAPDAKTPKRRY